MSKYTKKQKLKRTNPMLYRFLKIYVEEYGKEEISSYTDLENGLHRNISSIKDEKKLHELELTTKFQMECRERSGILSGGSLCLSVLVLFITYLSNVANANGKINDVALLLFGLTCFAFIFVDMITRYHSYDRHAIPYYKLKLECIEKVKKEMEEQKTKESQSKSTKKSKKH